MIAPVGSPELELEIAMDTGLICQSDRVEKTGLRPIWRSERDSNARYTSRTNPTIVPIGRDLRELSLDDRVSATGQAVWGSLA
jgi:hypothetical protein